MGDAADDAERRALAEREEGSDDWKIQELDVEASASYNTRHLVAKINEVIRAVNQTTEDMMT